MSKNKYLPDIWSGEMSCGLSGNILKAFKTICLYLEEKEQLLVVSMLSRLQRESALRMHWCWLIMKITINA